MADVNDVLQFLDEAGVFFLATEEGDQAKCRPLGFKMVKDGHLCFGVGTHKNVYKQLLTNPKCEITACVKDHWIRITGRAVPVKDPAYMAKAEEILPMLKDIYNEKSGLTMGIFYVKGTAAFCNIMGQAEKTAELA